MSRPANQPSKKASRIYTGSDGLNLQCPKHRFNRTENGDTGLNALCSGYHMFYDHTLPYMLKMKELLEAQTSPALVMPWARMRKD